MKLTSTAISAAALVAGMLTAGTAAGQAAPPGGGLFGAACAFCHGYDGRGGDVAPSLVNRVAALDDAALATFLRVGIPERGMPPAAVGEADFPELIGYLRFLARAAGAVAAAPGAAAGGSAPDTPVPGTPSAGSSPSAVSSAAASPRADADVPPPGFEAFEPVTSEMLLDPDPADWLWFSRTPDAQRFSPLDQIDRGNVGGLALAWSRGLPSGLSTAIPTVYRGVMYLILPGAAVVALDATNGDTLWEYRREYASPGVAAQSRAKNLSIFDDMVYFTAPDAAIVALDARTGEVRWEAQADNRAHTSGSIVVDGKLISSGNCIGGPRDNCFIAAHDARTGELRWKFNTVQAPTDPPGFDTWAGTPLEQRLASPWGLPGSYDPAAGLLYWGVANPMPNTRTARHGGNARAIPYTAPADLYSNSTVALDPSTGKLAWYYQHLPGDDWDLDMNQERVLVTTRVNPDPAHVRWINPRIERGRERDVVVNVGEGGGLWVLDRHTGEFLWATPFPFDVPNFAVGDIDVTTGIARINDALIVDEPGERHTICYFNTRSYWPTAYHPGKNALYVPYIRNCLDMTAEVPATAELPAVPESRVGTPEPGVALDELNGLAKVDLETGRITHWPTGRIPTNSAILATAGNLVFWGDINRRYRAIDAESGEVLWEAVLGGPIATSNITYAVNGRQYVAVIAGETLSQRVLTTGTMGPIQMDLRASYGNNSIYVFALPAGRGE